VLVAAEVFVEALGAVSAVLCCVGATVVGGAL
jgi:hypothetical protein